MPLGTVIDLGPGLFVLDGAHCPLQKGAQLPSTSFWPMSFVAKRSTISATAELLFLISKIHSFYAANNAL